MSKTYTIEATFATQVTVPGPVAYSSTQTRAGFTLTEEIEADSPEEARDIALQRANEIAEDAKIAVAANAGGGVTIATDDHGVSQLVFNTDGGEATEGKAASAAPADTTPTETGGESAPSAPIDSSELPKAHGNDRYTVVWNGQPVTLFDNRETKQGNQPDFKIVYEDGSDDPFWMELKNGGKNRAALALAAMVREADEKAA